MATKDRATTIQSGLEREMNTAPNNPIARKNSENVTALSKIRRLKETPGGKCESSPAACAAFRASTSKSKHHSDQVELLKSRFIAVPKV